MLTPRADGGVSPAPQTVLRDKVAVVGTCVPPIVGGERRAGVQRRRLRCRGIRVRRSPRPTLPRRVARRGPARGQDGAYSAVCKRRPELPEELSDGTGVAWPLPPRPRPHALPARPRRRVWSSACPRWRFPTHRSRSSSTCSTSGARASSTSGSTLPTRCGAAAAASRPLAASGAGHWGDASRRAADTPPAGPGGQHHARVRHHQPRLVQELRQVGARRERAVADGTAWRCERGRGWAVIASPDTLVAAACSRLPAGVLVANKVDLRDTGREAVSAEEGRRFAESLGLDYVETSAVRVLCPAHRGPSARPLTPAVSGRRCCSSPAQRSRPPSKPWQRASTAPTQSGWGRCRPWCRHR